MQSFWAATKDYVPITLAGLMIMASHRTCSGQNKHMSGQIKFGQTIFTVHYQWKFNEFVDNNECLDKFLSLS